MVPSLSQWLWLMVFLLLLTKPWRTVMVSADGDACLHWRVGTYMLQTGQIIRHDVFSHTRCGAPVIAREWLAQILYALVGRAAGLTGLSILAALVIATTFALLHRQLVREGNDLLTATLVTVLAMWAAITHWLARPHVFSFLLLVLWHDALRRHQRTGHLGRLLAWLAVLMLLWVNIHGAYLAGFFVLAAYWFGTLLEKHLTRLAHLTLAGLVCVAVAMLNPNGLRLHLSNVAFLRNPFFAGWLNEYLSPNLQAAGSLGFLLWMALVFFTLALTRPRLRPTESVLLVMWGYFALYAGRNVSLFAILTAPIVAPPIADLVRRQWPALCERLQTTERQASGWPVVALLAVIGLVTIPQPTTLPRDQWPTDAVAYIREHHDQFAGNMFNLYKWGGYLLESLPEHKVFVDGRADLYGETLCQEWEQVAGLRPGWQEVLARYDVAWSLVPVDSRLAIALDLLPNWSKVYTDDVAVIHVRTD